MSRLTVLSYNICDGGAERRTALADVIRGVGPDAAALLEANDRAASEELAGALGMRLVFGEANNRKHHIAWLSGLPVGRTASHRHPGLAKTLLEMEVQVEGVAIGLFATHLGSRWDVPQPADEVPIILDLLRSASGRPHLLLGDLNALGPGDPIGTPPEGVTWRGNALGAPRPEIGLLLDAGYTDCYRGLWKERPGYTYPAEHPWLRLDYIFASPELAGRLCSCDVVQTAEAAEVSDHLPVWASFSL